MSPTRAAAVAVLLTAALLGASCASTTGAGAPHPERAPNARDSNAFDRLAAATSWVYQLQKYTDGRLDEIAAAHRDVAVIDLSRDAGKKWFRPDEIASVQATGTLVLAYFEIGSLEDFRPEMKTVRATASDLLANRWPEWPDETFVRYWDPRWWDLVIRPRLDQALAAGFDGVYLDTPLAYEELDLAQADGHSRDQLAVLMVSLIERIAQYTKARHAGFLVVPQNSPELYRHPGYLPAIDGLAMEELWYEATDIPCTAGYCAENLKAAKAVHAAGKPVLTVDYAADPAHVTRACQESRAAGFVPYVAPLELNRVSPACP